MTDGRSFKPIFLITNHPEYHLMFNFTRKKAPKLTDARQPTTGLGQAYSDALKKIGQLEDELGQCHHAQYIMGESVKNCSATLHAVQNQLYTLVAHLDRSSELVAQLTEENRALKSSSEQWVRRAIKLEFDVLATKDELKKAESMYDLAVKLCGNLRSELMLADKEKSRDGHQG